MEIDDEAAIRSGIPIYVIRWNHEADSIMNENSDLWLNEFGSHEAKSIWPNEFGNQNFMTQTVNFSTKYELIPRALFNLQHSKLT